MTYKLLREEEHQLLAKDGLKRYVMEINSFPYEEMELVLPPDKTQSELDECVVNTLRWREEVNEREKKRQAAHDKAEAEWDLPDEVKS